MFFDPILVKFFEHSCVLRQWNIVFGRCFVSRPDRPKQEDFVGLTTYFPSIQAWIWACLVGPKRIVEMFFDPIFLRSSEHFCLLKQRETFFILENALFIVLSGQNRTTLSTLPFKFLHSNRDSGNYWLVLSALWRCSLIKFFDIFWTFLFVDTMKKHMFFGRCSVSCSARPKQDDFVDLTTRILLRSKRFVKRLRIEFLVQQAPPERKLFSFWYCLKRLLNPPRKPGCLNTFAHWFFGPIPFRCPH